MSEDGEEFNGSCRPTIGVVSGWKAYYGRLHSFLIPMIRGIRIAARLHGCNLLVGLGHNFEAKPRTAWPTNSSNHDFVPVGPWNTDGLIVLGPALSEERRQYCRRLVDEGFPLVFIGPGGPTSAVVSDNVGGIEKALQHLVEHGHKRVAFVASVLGNGDIHPGSHRVRLEGYRRAVAELGLEEDADLILTSIPVRGESRRIMRERAKTKLDFTAVLGINDEIAGGVIDGLHDAGYRVPDDIAVIGFDNWFEAAAAEPPLTTVHVPCVEMGSRSVQLLLKHIRGEVEDDRVVTLPSSLLVRQSCGCPRFSKRRIPEISGSVAHAMGEAITAQTSYLDQDQVFFLSDRLVNAFSLSLDHRRQDPFYSTLEEVLKHTRRANDPPNVWQLALSILEASAERFTDGSALLLDHLDELLRRARVMIAEMIDTDFRQYSVGENDLRERLHWLSTSLLSVVDEKEIVEIVDTRLEPLGIEQTDLAFYMEEGDDPVHWSSLLSHSIDDLETDQRESGFRFPTREFPPEDLYSRTEPFEVFILPLAFSGNLLGFVAFKSPNAEVLAHITQQLATAVSTARLHRRVEELSLTDTLTGLRNRRFFEQRLRREMERSREEGLGLTVIMLDLDGFKEYNDTYGHPEGDQALTFVAEAIKSACRRTDISARYGGDEFVVALPETDADRAVVVARRVGEQVESNDGFRSSMSVSIGLAGFSGDEALEDLVKKADQALYRSKSRGNGVISVFNDEMVGKRKE